MLQRWHCHPISWHTKRDLKGSPLMLSFPPPSTANPSQSPFHCPLNVLESAHFPHPYHYRSSLASGHHLLPGPLQYSLVFSHLQLPPSICLFFHTAAARSFQTPVSFWFHMSENPLMAPTTLMMQIKILHVALMLPALLLTLCTVSSRAPFSFPLESLPGLVLWFVQFSQPLFIL